MARNQGSYDEDAKMTEAVIVKETPTNCLGFLFLLTSFGYMLPWTSLGSLISYYKANYGANFYVLIYFCYYLPGLPVAIFQNFCGESIDMLFGSFRTYLLRGILFFCAMITVLLMMINCEVKAILYVLFVLLGISGWACHGTACQLASMHSPEVIAMLQTGFRCPEIFAIIVVSILHIGRSSNSSQVNDLYILTAIAVLIGMVSWICACVAPESRECFSSKDCRVQEYDAAEVTPLLVEAHTTAQSHGVRKSIQHSDSALWLDDDDIDREANIITIDLDSNDSNAEEFISTITPKSESTCLDVVANLRPRSPADSKDLFEKYRHTGQAAKAPVAMRPSIMASKSLLTSENHPQPLWMLCAALMITIYCSIFQAAFFAYVDSRDGWEIEQILYFTRLFSDLFGRPLTRLPRPFFMKSNFSLLVASILRIGVMVVFFMYIMIPDFPQDDMMICSLVSVFSIMSGYFSVLIYEYAAAQCKSKLEQTQVTALLNISFQTAAFLAVTSSVLVTHFAGGFDR